MVVLEQASLLCLRHGLCLFEDFQGLNFVNRIHREVFFRDTQQIVRYRHLTSNDGLQLIVKIEGQDERGDIMEIVREDQCLRIDNWTRISQLFLFQLCISEEHFDTLFFVELINQEFLFRWFVLLKKIVPYDINICKYVDLF